MTERVSRYSTVKYKPTDSAKYWEFLGVPLEKVIFFKRKPVPPSFLRHNKILCFP
jgi:hypothetical protein